MSDIGNFSYDHHVTADELLGGSGRLGRAKFVLGLFDPRSMYFMQDGKFALRVFQESVDAFVDGRYVSAIALGFTFIERAIAGRLHFIGQAKAAEDTGHNLLAAAHVRKWLTDEELSELTTLRQFRNVLVHFRDPLDLKRPEVQALVAASTLEQHLEKQAQVMLHAISRVLNYTAL